MQELLQQLQERQRDFSPVQRAIADYIITNYAAIPFQSISQVAEHANVSEASVFFFCKELGFSGFADLKRSISGYINNSLQLNNRFACTAASLTKANAISEVTRCDIENIQATLSNPTNLENIPTLLAMIDRAKHIYTFGGRSAGFFADFLAFKLRQQDLNVSNINFNVGDYIDKMMMIRPGDLVIVFSFPRYTKRIVEMVRELHQREIPVVLITSETLSPCFEYSDLVFYCRSVSCSYVASYTACLTLINAILISRALQHKKHTEAYLARLEQNLMDFDMFYGQ